MPSSIPPSYTNVARTALLVYDMQRGIAKQISEAERVIAACKTAIDAARRVGMRIAYSKHMSLPGAWLGSTQLRTAMMWQRVQKPEEVKGWFARGSEASEIVPELNEGTLSALDELKGERRRIGLFLLWKHTT